MGQQFRAAERVEKRGGSLRKQVGAGEEMRDRCEGKVCITQRKAAMLSGLETAVALRKS